MFWENKSWVIYYQVCYKNVLHVNHAVTLTGISCFKLKHEFGHKKIFSSSYVKSAWTFLKIYFTFCCIFST